MMVVSPFLYTPFYLAGMYAIWKGKDWIRVPVLMYSAMLLYSLMAIIGENVYGEAHHRTPNLPVRSLLRNLHC